MGDRKSALFILLCVSPLLAQTASPAVTQDRLNSFRFENYDRFLGFGSPDQARAEREFVKTFPIGTPLDEMEKFFQKIGGRCFALREGTGTFYCDYAYPKFWFLPFLPVASTWLVTIEFNQESRTSTRIGVVAGTEGP